ncbi:MAG: hypothetical protein V2A62_03695, partial [Candidatus Woesearchaeota archaeon]
MKEQAQKLHQLVKELEELEIQTRKTQLPRDWFWHHESIEAVKKLSEFIQREIVSISKQGIDDYLKYSLRDFAQVIEDLNNYLTKIDSRNFDSKDIPDFQSKINSLLQRADSYLTSFINRLNFLEHHLPKDDLFEKKKILVSMGFNIFRYPEYAAMFFADWSMIEEVISIGKRFGDSEVKYQCIWSSLIPQFQDLVFIKISSAEIKQLRESIVGNKTPEEMYTDPNFLDNLREFQTQSQLKVLNLDQQKLINLHYLLVVLALIIRGGTVGQHLGQTVCEWAIPNLKNYLHDSDDLKFLYTQLSDINKINSEDLYLAPCRLAEILYEFERENTFAKKYQELFSWRELVLACTKIVIACENYIVFSALSILIKCISQKRTITLNQAVEGITSIGKRFSKSDLYSILNNQLFCLSEYLNNGKITWDQTVEGLIKLNHKVGTEKAKEIL